MTVHQLAEHTGVSRQAVYKYARTRGMRLPLHDTDIAMIQDHYRRKTQAAGPFIIPTAGIKKDFDYMVGALVAYAAMSRGNAVALVRQANMGTEEEKWKLYKRAFPGETP